MPGSQSEATSAPKKRSARQKLEALPDDVAAAQQPAAIEATIEERNMVDPVVDVSASVNTSNSQEDERSAFLQRQREALVAERAAYTSQAEELKAQADSLALEHEPGDVQFDEEGGEGGTSNVDRELDLILSAQARAAITEIDLALSKIDNGTYGICEQCGDTIPEPRLEALPHASLCVACKSGGLNSRR